MQNQNPKVAIVIGAGPAGLTLATELLKRTNIHPIILEATKQIGGISQTVNYKGNRMDIGGHRFFSKSDRVTEWWADLLPLQGSPAIDDILLHREKTYNDNGPDPEKCDSVMLIRQRISRIFFLRHFFDYPISIKGSTFVGMGLKNTLRAISGYLIAIVNKLPETSLENFYINRFGRPLYEMFFENYTEKVWGVHPSKIGAEWGAQRVKGLSIFTLIKNLLLRPFRRKSITNKTWRHPSLNNLSIPNSAPDNCGH